MNVKGICTYLPRCRGRQQTRWVVHRTVAAGDAMTPPPTRRRHSLTGALSVHLSLQVIAYNILLCLKNSHIIESSKQASDENSKAKQKVTK